MKDRRIRKIERGVEKKKILSNFFWAIILHNIRSDLRQYCTTSRCPISFVIYKLQQQHIHLNYVPNYWKSMTTILHKNYHNYHFFSHTTNLGRNFVPVAIRNRDSREVNFCSLRLYLIEVAYHCAHFIWKFAFLYIFEAFNIRRILFR